MEPEVATPDPERATELIDGQEEPQEEAPGQEEPEAPEEQEAEAGSEEVAEAVDAVDDEPKQLPLEAWSEHQLAEAGIELANHLHKLKNYEDVEGRRRRHYKENRDRMVDVIEGLRLRIREQRHALGINVHPSNFSEEEE